MGLTWASGISRNQIQTIGTNRCCKGKAQQSALNTANLKMIEFTLAQLSNENLTLLFNNAFYEAEELKSKKDGGEDESIVTMVHLNDWNHLVYADESNHCLAFETRIYGIDTEMDLMLKICNFFDRFPVHANAFKDDDGSSGVCFIYKHIVPEGTSLSARSVIGVFRSFVQMFESHYAHWHQVKEAVA